MREYQRYENTAKLLHTPERPILISELLALFNIGSAISLLNRDHLIYGDEADRLSEYAQEIIETITEMFENAQGCDY